MNIERKLVLEDVTVRFGETKVLNRVSFPVWAGTTMALIGPNGAGKTTLLNAICGETSLSTGRILLDGVDLSGRSPSRIAKMGIGRLFQEVRVFKQLTVEENLLAAVPASTHGHRLVGYASRSDAAVNRDRARHWMDILDLSAISRERAGTLSFGQQKRVGLARLLIGDCRVLLLDEPSAGLDPAVRRSFLDKLRRLLDENNLTAIVIEHNIDAVRALADWTVGLNAGEVRFIGRTDHMIGDQGVQKWLMGLWNQ